MIPFLLPQAIEAACARWPGRTAIIDTSGTPLTFAALEHRSRLLAARIQAASVPPGARVGLWMSKSTSAVVALLAILRAGAIYVPLDPWAPPARIEALATDCSLALLLCDPDHAAPAAAWRRPPALLWTLSPELVSDSIAALWRSVPAVADDVAYILYTSGSTGVPKGVMLTHAHALNFIRWAAAATALVPGDRVASHAPFHFDLSIFDLWASLSHGATVCLLDPVTARFPRAVADWILACHITVWYSVPSALVALLPYAPQLASTLRLIAFAGEVFPPPALRAWRDAAPAVAFHNWFGPTETNVCAHYALSASSVTPSPLPIGHACPNFELAIADEEALPLPPGASGFLWARGPGVFAGYWADPDRSRSATRLRPGPGGRPQLWYNTGDIVCRDEAGALLFLGRRDHMIKLRGYRISLLEIESALASCPGVRRAAVVPSPAAGPPSGLRAVLVPAASAPPPLPDLLAFLRRRLPAYMLPDAFEFCSALPETSNGKVDRQRLQSGLGGLTRAAGPD